MLKTKPFVSINDPGGKCIKITLFRIKRRKKCIRIAESVSEQPFCGSKKCIWIDFFRLGGSLNGPGAIILDCTKMRIGDIFRAATGKTGLRRGNS